MKTLLPLLSLGCLVLFVACGKDQAAPRANKATTDVIKRADALLTAIEEVIDDDAILIDVREQSEWDEKRLEKAFLVPMSKIKEDVTCIEDVEGIDKTVQIYVYGAKDGQATKMADVLSENGYNATPLEVAFEELVNQGLELAKKKTPESDQ